MVLLIKNILLLSEIRMQKQLLAKIMTEIFILSYTNKSESIPVLEINNRSYDSLCHQF